MVGGKRDKEFVPFFFLGLSGRILDLSVQSIGIEINRPQEPR